MAFQFSGSNYLSHGTGMFSALPITLFAWVKNPGGGVDEVVGGVERNVSPWERAVMFIQASGVPFASYRDAGASLGQASSQTVTTAWHPCMCVFTGGSQKIYYTTGDASGNSSGTSGSDVANQLVNWYIGRGVFGNYAGEVAEFALWNTALGDTEWASLKAGALPEDVSAGSLVDLLKMDTLSYVSLNGRTLTLSGAAPSLTTHPISRVSSILSGGATLGDVGAAGDIASIASSLTGGATLGDITAAGVLGLQPGVITSQPIKNWSGSVLAGVTIPKVAFLRVSDMAQVLMLTNLVTSGAGTLTVSNAALLVGVQYLLVTCNADGTAFGCEPYVAA